MSRRVRRGPIQIFGQLDSAVASVREAIKYLETAQYIQVHTVLTDVLPRLEDLRLFFRSRITPTLGELPNRVREHPTFWRDGIWVFVLDENNNVIRRKLISKDLSIAEDLVYEMNPFTVERPPADISTKLVTIKVGNEVVWKNERLPKKTHDIKLGVIQDGNLRFV